MKCTNGKILSISVMVILLLTFTTPIIPINAGLSVPSLDEENVHVGDIITVSGIPADATAGSPVKVYWDIASGFNARLVNTTTGKPDGSYEVEITVPDTEEGIHYVWVEDVATETIVKSGAITVSPEIDTDRNSGLPGDELTVEGTGFDGEAEVNITLYNQTAPNVWDWNSTVIDSNDAIETDDYGTFAATFDIPAIEYGIYTINATDGTNWAEVNFTVNTAISLTPDNGPEGTVIEITGRGFDPNVTLSVGNITWADTDNMALLTTTVSTNASGAFNCEVVAPSWGVGEWEISVSDNNNRASENFTIDGVATVMVDPTYAAPGSVITVEGYNFTQIAGLDVTVTLSTATATSLVTATTNAKGTWSDTFTTPAVSFDNYLVHAKDEYGVNASDSFKVGLIAMIINPTSGPSGTEVALTAVGFADGDYNMSFGGDDDYLEGTVVGETISATFIVPTVVAGTYSVGVIDMDDNFLSTTFTVTETTSLTPTPSNVTVGYNMSIYGEHFSEAAGLSIEWFISNSTWDAELTTVNGSLYTDVASSDDGNFTGYWIVPDSLLIGNTYTINATDANGLFAEFTINVVEEEIEIRPLSTDYQPGDTIAYRIKTIFTKTDAYLTISDPTEYPYWISTFNAGDWVSVGNFQVVPIYRQVSDVHSLPFTLPIGAMSGSWSWVFRSSVGEIITSGNFTVVDLPSSQVDPFTLNVSAGWNMISIPFLPQDPSASSVLSDVSFYQLVTWSGTGYEVATEFELGKGYWLLVLEDTSISITG